MLLELKINIDKVSGVGKNNFGITKNGIHYPKKNFKIFREKFITEIKKQLSNKTDFKTINIPVKLTLWYKPLDKRMRDATAILDAVFHIFEYCRIIENDALIKKIDYQELNMETDFVFYIRLESIDEFKEKGI